MWSNGLKKLQTSIKNLIYYYNLLWFLCRWIGQRAVKHNVQNLRISHSLLPKNSRSSSRHPQKKKKKKLRDNDRRDVLKRSYVRLHCPPFHPKKEPNYYHKLLEIEKGILREVAQDDKHVQYLKQSADLQSTNQFNERNERPSWFVLCNLQRAVYQLGLPRPRAQSLFLLISYNINSFW